VFLCAARERSSDQLHSWPVLPALFFIDSGAQSSSAEAVPSLHEGFRPEIASRVLLPYLGFRLGFSSPLKASDLCSWTCLLQSAGFHLPPEPMRFSSARSAQCAPKDFPTACDFVSLHDEYFSCPD
jgi:hypothetical protein